jgi:predicted permease
VLTTILAVVPVFVLIAIGYGAVRLHYLPDAMSDHLNAYAIKLAVPVLLFTAMVDIDFAEAFSAGVFISFYAGALVCFVAGIVMARLVFARRPGEAVSFGFAATFSNSLLLGVPIVERAHGADALPVAFGIIALHAPLLYTIGMITMEMMRRDGRSLGETLRSASRSIIANPLMIAIACGIAWNVSGLPLPQMLAVPFDMLAGSAIPAALVGLGAALTRYTVKANISETLAIAVLSLIIHPAIALGLSHYVLALPAHMVIAIVTVAAMPPGVNIYIFASLYDRAVPLAASALVISTAIGVASISVWIYALAAIFG